MNRRGFFGALAGGITAMVGRSVSATTPLAAAPSGGIGGLRCPVAPLGGKFEFTPVFKLHLADLADEAVGPPVDPDPETQAEGRSAEPDIPLHPDDPAFWGAGDAPQASPADLPFVWPGHIGTITATASLPPLAQVERLVELFGESGDAAPSFAAALIGELVLTRMRLAVTDPRRMFAP